MTENLAPRPASASTEDAHPGLGKAALVGAVMDAAYLEKDLEPETAPAVFEIRPQGAKWHVTLDGHLLGYYRRIDHAMDSVEAKAIALRTPGRAVTIVTLSSSGAVLVSTVLGAG